MEGLYFILGICVGGIFTALLFSVMLSRAMDR